MKSVMIVSLEAYKAYQYRRKQFRIREPSEGKSHKKKEEFQTQDS